jgi:hypothetical protein
MGTTASTPKDEQIIIDEMSTFGAKWISREGGDKVSQTHLFREIMSTEGVDFSGPFHEHQLDGIFTSSKIVLPIVGGGYNCNHLFRDSNKETKIPVYSDDNYTVMHPLGVPGLHLGEGHGSKASHLMIIRHSSGPITFNEMLPSTSEEVLDLETRLAVLTKVVENMRANTPLYTCGPKVCKKANDLCIDGLTGIRDYLAMVIAKMPEEERSGPPGYKLMNKENVDVSTNDDKVRDLLNDVYGNAALKPFMAIQPPSENSQLLSHIHCFMVEKVPECMAGTYRDASLILKYKIENMPNDERSGGGMGAALDESEEEDDGGELTRQATRVTGGSY